MSSTQVVIPTDELDRAVAAVHEVVDPIWNRTMQDPEAILSDFLEEFLEDPKGLMALISKKSGLRVLGYGNSRVALELPGDLAVKVAMHGEGEDNNQNEEWTWNKVREADIGQHFMPIIAVDPDGKWLLMPLADKWPNGEEVPVDSRNAVREYCIDDGDYNWGVWNGKPVLLDYE